MGLCKMGLVLLECRAQPYKERDDTAEREFPCYALNQAICYRSLTSSCADVVLEHNVEKPCCGQPSPHSTNQSQRHSGNHSNAGTQSVLLLLRMLQYIAPLFFLSPPISKCLQRCTQAPGQPHRAISCQHAS